MIYKSEFPVFLFSDIRVDPSFEIGYNFKIFGSKLRNDWPDAIVNDTAIDKTEWIYDAPNIGCPKSMNCKIHCINNERYFTLLDASDDYVFIKLSPGKWFAMTRSAFSALYRYTGKSMDQLPVFISYAEPMSSDDDFTVMRPIYDTNNSVTIGTEYARMLYPSHTSKDNICKRSDCHLHLPDWIEKYTFSLYDDVTSIYLDTDIMFIKGKFGIFNRDDVLAFIGVRGHKPIIYVCKNISSKSLYNKDRVIKEPEPCEVLSPKEYTNLDKKQIPTIIDIEEDADKGFFNTDIETATDMVDDAVKLYDLR